MRYTEDSCSLQEFIAVISNGPLTGGLKHTTTVEKNVPIYDSAELRVGLQDSSFKHSVMDEFCAILRTGAGVFVLKQAYSDTTAIGLASETFNEIIREERNFAGGDDHFAEPGANARIWNALEKLCIKAPDVFAPYYANDMIALACEAWLGPAYQMTSQVNVVHPGGEAQQPHCDYHLGFQSTEEVSRYPAHVFQLSPALTLQGAIAHCHMPVNSGPTK